MRRRSVLYVAVLASLILALSAAGSAAGRGDLSDAPCTVDIEALRSQAQEEGWTFTVGENPATRYTLDQLCGLKEPENWRENAKFVKITPSLSLPSRFDWRDTGGCTPIKDQGPCGSCWAFATVGPLECNILIKDGVEVDLSEQWLVSCNTNGWGCGGGWWAHQYHEWRPDPCGHHGAVLEEYFPYIAMDYPCDCPYPHDYWIDNWAYFGSGSTPAVSDIKQAIMDYGPVSAAVFADGAFLAYTGGIFTGPSYDDVNHGVVLVGWDDSQGTDGVWFLRNSWGPGWGEDGYMRIEYGACDVGYRACFVDYQRSPTHKLAVFYVIPSNTTYDDSVYQRLVQSTLDVQAWYQVASGGLTWLLEYPEIVKVYNADHTWQYYRDHGDWWGSLLGEMASKGHPIWSPGTVTAIWARGAGWWAGGAQGCGGDCGVALLGVSLFPEFNDPLYSGGSCPGGQGVGGWPCTPEGAYGSALGSTLGLIRPIYDPVTAPYAYHSIMQTHWNFPDHAPPSETPWGFLSVERQAIRANRFMYSGVDLIQPYPRADVVNLPTTGVIPVADFTSSTRCNRATFSNESIGATHYYWTFGDGSVSNKSNPVHLYDEPGKYTVTLRASNDACMMDLDSLEIRVGPRTWYILPDGSGDAPTIQAGIDSCAPGDTVLVGCGTYFEHNIYLASGITLRSETGQPDCVTIDADTLGRVFCGVEVGDATIEGFTITRGSATRGGGIYFGAAHLTMSDCIFLDNEATVDGGGAACEYCNVTFDDCVFSGNSTIEGCGGGIYFKSASASISGCSFSDNTAGSGCHGAMSFFSSTAGLQNTIVAFSKAGEGVGCDTTSSVELTCCDIYGNAGGDWVGCISEQCGVNGNFCEDPSFCDHEGGDYHLGEGSPCGPDEQPDCGLIGALGVGCYSGVQIEDETGQQAGLSVTLGSTNPSGRDTQILFTIPSVLENSVVRLNVYDCTGRLVSTLANEHYSRGRHRVLWNTADDRGHRVSSGIYFICLQAGDQVATRKVVITR